MASPFAEKEDAEFKQLILLFMNGLWLLLEYLWMDWTKPWKFRICRVVYFAFLSFTRIDLGENPDSSDDFYPMVWKTIKTFICDLFTMVLLVWAFGCSIL